MRCRCLSRAKSAITYAATVPQLFHLRGGKDFRFNRDLNPGRTFASVGGGELRKRKGLSAILGFIS